MGSRESSAVNTDGMIIFIFIVHEGASQPCLNRKRTEENGSWASGTMTSGTIVHSSFVTFCWALVCFWGDCSDRGGVVWWKQTSISHNMQQKLAKHQTRSLIATKAQRRVSERIYRSNLCCQDWISRSWRGSCWFSIFYKWTILHTLYYFRYWCYKWKCLAHSK